MKSIRIHYLDASAAVKLYVSECGSDALRSYFEKESHFLMTSLCFSETIGVLKVKYLYREELAEEDYFSACDELLAHAAGGSIEIENVHDLDRSMFIQVERLAKQYNAGKPKDKKLDIADVFQIVSIKQNCFSSLRQTESEPILITGDEALAAAARAEGLRVWNCVNEPPPERRNEA